MNKSLKVASNYIKNAYDFSSVQLELPYDIAQKIYTWGLDNIPNDILTDKGREDDIHITLKYGIHITDFTALRNMFLYEGPIPIELGDITLFVTNPDFDVIKIDIISPDLYRLNKLISDHFEVTDTHPEYHPHATICYVNKSSGSAYNGRDDFKGTKISLDTVEFSGRDNRKTQFKLINQRKAYFNQALWLPGRSTRTYPIQYQTKRQKTIMSFCPSCNEQSYSNRIICPRCGSIMRRFEKA